MLDFAKLCHSWNVTTIEYFRYNEKAGYTPEETRERDVLSPEHPQFSEVLRLFEETRLFCEANGIECCTNWAID
jgi:hypothetical protein